MRKQKSDGVCTHPQAVDAFKRISALLGLPLALAPALPARGVGGVGGCVWTLCVGAALHADGIILQRHTHKKDTGEVMACLGCMLQTCSMFAGYGSRKKCK